MVLPIAYVRRVLARSDGEWLSFICPRCAREHYVAPLADGPAWSVRLTDASHDVPAACTTGTGRRSPGKVRLVLDWTRAEKVTG